MRGILSDGTGTSTIAPGFTNTGLIKVTAGTLSFIGGVTNTGTVLASGGTLFADSALSGTDLIEMLKSGVTNFGTTVSTGQTVEFGDATGTIDLQDPANFQGLVTYMAAGDFIDMINTTETGYQLRSVDRRQQRRCAQPADRG